MNRAKTANTPEAPFSCELCPRLVKYRQQNAQDEPSWHNGPVDSFGGDGAAFLVIGMAPGRGGANRTGRPFTGDGAGDVLFKALLKHEFASGTYGQSANDGLRLNNCMITNVVRCVPPQNRPKAIEANNCRPFLLARLAALPNLSVMMALGHIAHNSVLSAFDVRKKDYKFGHGAIHTLSINDRRVILVNSYHCSRYNTNTKRLTEEMFDEVFLQIKKYL